MRLTACVALACVLAGGIQAAPSTPLRGTHGRFTSPGFPNVYADNLNKTWQITVRPGYRIEFKFTAFDLEDSYEQGLGPCVYDYVLIMEGTKEIERFCGNTEHYVMDSPRLNQKYYTEGNSATVIFVSDYSNEAITPTGFDAHYVEVDIDECEIMRQKEMYTVEDWDELLTCDHFCNNVPGSAYCSCRSQYKLHEDKHTCIATFCENQVLTADQGFVESPNYPENYAKYADCSWHIQVRDGLSVHLTFFTPFALERHIDEGCAYDKLKITHNDREDEYCGDEVPVEGQVMDMNTKDVKITFTSDRSVEMAGFKLHYNTSRIRCLTSLSAPANGGISDNPKGYYEFEDVVTFNCIVGYEFTRESEERLECLSNGQWNHPQPVCQIKVCGPPQHLINVNYSSIVDFETKRFEYGERVTVKCDSWYKMTSGYATWRCEDSKLWVQDSGMISPAETKCRPKCGDRLVAKDSVAVQSAGAKKVKKAGGWPWMAFVDMGGGRSGTDYCGGTLVDEKTVVTAAHCVQELDIDDDVIVWLGLLDRKIDNFNYTQRFTVSHDRRFVHAEYGVIPSVRQSFDSDIAILKLDRPANLSYFVHPICVPNSEANQERMIADYKQKHLKAVVAGWGQVETGNFSQHLMKTRVPFVDTNRCRQKYGNAFRDGEDMITDNMICAGYDHGRNDACKGDSGGPLMTSNNRKWYLNGIVSFGDENHCGESETYGVYTDVGKFSTFLSQQMEK